MESIEYALARCDFKLNPSLDDYALANVQSRELAAEFLKYKIKK